MFPLYICETIAVTYGGLAIELFLLLLLLIGLIVAQRLDVILE